MAGWWFFWAGIFTLATVWPSLPVTKVVRCIGTKTRPWHVTTIRGGSWRSSGIALDIGIWTTIRRLFTAASWQSSAVKKKQGNYYQILTFQKTHIKQLHFLRWEAISFEPFLAKAGPCHSAVIGSSRVCSRAICTPIFITARRESIFIALVIWGPVINCAASVKFNGVLIRPQQNKTSE